MTTARGVPADLFAGMNKLERTHALALESQRRAGRIVAWHYESLTLKLAPDCRYTPDFLVITEVYEVELHETKGHWREDARVKFRTATRLFPHFRFRAFRMERGAITEETMTP